MAHNHPSLTPRERQLIDPCPVASVMCRTFDALSAGRHFAASWLVCEWAGVVTSARRSSLPAVRADRLRSAAEFRAEIAREKGRA